MPRWFGFVFPSVTASAAANKGLRFSGEIDGGGTTSGGGAFVLCAAIMRTDSEIGDGECRIDDECKGGGLLDLACLLDELCYCC